MKAKNKTLFLLIMGFVFLFLAGALRSGLAQKITAKNITDIESARAGLILDEASPEEVFAEENLKAELSDAPLPVEKKLENYYKVVKVVDGDTIDINIGGKTERLRLIGVNTPEVVDPRKPVECFGREASSNAHELLDGQEVEIASDQTQDDRDKYGRLLRYVWRADGFFYNLEAIRSGFAYEYTYQIPYQYQKEFKAAQKYAEENKLGLWADGVCGQKNISAEKNISNSNDNCTIKGNISSSGGRIYHLPSCAYYKQTVIEESKGEKWFCTEEEAVAAGWRKAGNCP